MSVTYKNSTNELNILQALILYEGGVSVIINDGSDVTFQIEDNIKKCP